MKSKRIIFALFLILSVALFGCNGGGSVSDDQVAGATDYPALADGTYTVKFTTDNTMFHVNEVCDGKATLTVSNGQMTVHLIMPSKNVLNLYPGLSEDAAKEGAELINPTTETVTYPDGLSEEVYAYDVPVPYLDEEFDLALIGNKEIWYDHKVVVSSPVEDDETEATEEAEETEAADDTETETAESEQLINGGRVTGTYTCEFDFEGGSGKAYIESPAILNVDEEQVTATITWSSENYDYMIVDGEKYLPENTEGNSVFTIPVTVFDQPITVIGDTVAMSQPYEIEYTITFHADSVTPVDDTTDSEQE